MLLVFTAKAFSVSDFAVEVVDYSGGFGPFPYDDPNAVLGKPATQCINDDPDINDPVFRVKLIEAAYNLDLNRQKVITTINPGEYIVVKFDHKIVDFPLNPYGQDFIVFGNAAFKVQLQQGRYVGDGANMNTLQITAPAEVSFEEIWVSVSQDGQRWYSYQSGPWADDYYPTQAYKWDSENAQWTDEEMDFTCPVDPNLGLMSFNGVVVSEAIELYKGSGGGTSFDLKDLPEYDELLIDPETGLRWIQYIRLEGGQGIYAIGGEVDAMADVAVCGDPTHPYPAGDITRDCRVDLSDLAVLSATWLECTYKCDP